MNQVLMTLHRFLLSWLTDDKFREDNPDIKQAMQDNGLADVSGEDVRQAMMLVADELPPYQAQQMSSYLNAPSGAYNSSNFNINQGGSASAAGGQAASHGGNATGASGSAYTTPPPDPHGDGPLDEAVREIQYITNNYSTTNETNTTNIDDRDFAYDGSVRQSINNTGNLQLDQEFSPSIATGDGAVSGDVQGSVNTGTNTGIFGAGDVQDANLVTGDNNLTTGRDANLITGDVTGPFVGDDVQTEGNVNLGGNQTTVEGDVQNSAISNEGEAANALVEGSGFGSGSEATNAQINVGSGSASQHVDQEVNETTEIKDSYNTDDSFNTKDSFNNAQDSFDDANDSFSQIDQSASAVTDDVTDPSATL